MLWPGKIRRHLKALPIHFRPAICCAPKRRASASENWIQPTCPASTAQGKATPACSLAGQSRSACRESSAQRSAQRCRRTEQFSAAERTLIHSVNDRSPKGAPGGARGPRPGQMPAQDQAPAVAPLAQLEQFLPSRRDIRLHFQREQDPQILPPPGYGIAHSHLVKKRWPWNEKMEPQS